MIETQKSDAPLNLFYLNEKDSNSPSEKSNATDSAPSGKSTATTSTESSTGSEIERKKSTTATASTEDITFAKNETEALKESEDVTTSGEQEVVSTKGASTAASTSTKTTTTVVATSKTTSIKPVLLPDPFHEVRLLSCSIVSFYYRKKMKSKTIFRQLFQELFLKPRLIRMSRLRLHL